MADQARPVDEQRATPLQTCPVCGGRGYVPNGFYYQQPGTAPMECRTCKGHGIVGGVPEAALAQAEQERDDYKLAAAAEAQHADEQTAELARAREAREKVEYRASGYRQALEGANTTMREVAEELRRLDYKGSGDLRALADRLDPS